MFENYAGIKLLCFFFDNPHSEFYLREIANKNKLSTSTTKSWLGKLAKNKFLIKHKRGNMIIFKANLDSPSFRHAKITYSLKKIQDSQLLKALKEHLNPSSIVLFGGAARGEDDARSDLDLLIISKRKKIDLSSFEAKLKREINCIIYPPVQWNEKAKRDKPFYDRIITDGIVLFGELPVI